MPPRMKFARKVCPLMYHKIQGSAHAKSTLLLHHAECGTFAILGATYLEEFP